MVGEAHQTGIDKMSIIMELNRWEIAINERYFSRAKMKWKDFICLDTRKKDLNYIIKTQ